MEIKYLSTVLALPNDLIGLCKLYLEEDEISYYIIL